jgi:hypothetical protein
MQHGRVLRSLIFLMRITPEKPSATVQCCCIFRAKGQVTMVQAARHLETV